MAQTAGRTGALAAFDGLRAGQVTAAFRAVGSARTWLAVIHLLAGSAIGSVAFAVVVTGTAAGAGLIFLLLLGVPLLACVLWFCQWLARVERARFALLLGAAIPGPPTGAGARGARGMLWILRSASAWRSAAYAVVMLPLSLAELTVVIAVWSLGVALITLPTYNAALPGGSAHLGDFQVRPGWLVFAALAGLALLLAAPPVTRALAAVDTFVARLLLGATERATLAARIDELEASRALIVDAAEAERRRIERDLHDGAQQRLVSLAMELGRAKARFAADPETAAAIVDQAHEQAKQALSELRSLVRGVHPPVLTDRGLDAALSGLAALSPVPVTLRVDLPVRPSASSEAIAYFVVAEALTNVAKHSGATHADVTVTSSGDLLMLVISDNGIGGADPDGQGLSGLAARVAAVDGRLVVTSPAGGPTSIEARLPCGS